MEGMDVGQVRQLASQMTTAAGQIKEIQGSLTSALSATSWVGKDKTRFEGDWTSNYAKALDQVAQAIEDAAKTASSNADQQEQASS